MASVRKRQIGEPRTAALESESYKHNENKQKRWKTKKKCKDDLNEFVRMEVAGETRGNVVKNEDTQVKVSKKKRKDKELDTGLRHIPDDSPRVTKSPSRIDAKDDMALVARLWSVGLHQQAESRHCR